MSSFEVRTPTIAAAAIQMADASSLINELLGTLDNAQKQDWSENMSIPQVNGDTAGPAVWSAYDDMVADAWTAARALLDTLEVLTKNTALAGEGYLNTDQGIIPTDVLTYNLTGALHT